MIATCKKNLFLFKKDDNYKISGIFSIFKEKDFISIENDTLYRFRLDKSSDYIDNYIGEEEFYFYDYFSIITEDRKLKLENISTI